MQSFFTYLMALGLTLTVAVGPGFAKPKAAKTKQTKAAAAAPCGYIKSMSGKVLHKSKKAKKYIQIKKTPFPLHVGDSLRTDKGAFAKLDLFDGSTYRLLENSDLLINQFLFSKKKKQRKSVISVFRGQLAGIVSKWKGFNTDVKVETPTAFAGIRGTSFLIALQFVSKKGAKPEIVTVVTVVEGEIGVRSALGSVTREVVVRNGSRTAVHKGVAPQPARAVAQIITPQAFRQIIESEKPQEVIVTPIDRAPATGVDKSNDANKEDDQGEDPDPQNEDTPDFDDDLPPATPFN